MCGIVGTASSGSAPAREYLSRQIASLQHRGPDESGEWWSADGRVGLGHARLSILDLTPTGCQPMSSAGALSHIAFNGEIYNHAELRADLRERGVEFRGRSDTEVLLAAYEMWGVDVLQRINGMFAFALFDQRRQTLFLARDRAGEKPLHYINTGAAFHFASELKALVMLPGVSRVMDMRSLQHYLAYGYTPRDATMIQGIAKLPPAHAMVYDLADGSSRMWCYWTPPGPPPRMGDAGELVVQLETLLRAAVDRQLQADVPTSVLLSGGVDSSILTALAAAVRPGVSTYTVTFPASGRYDEASYARTVASHFGTVHTEIASGDIGANVLHSLARQFDDPIADSSMVPTYAVMRAVRRDATVTLGGDGGDELFGGYPLYQWAQKMIRVRRGLPQSARSAIAAAAGALPVGVRGRAQVLSIAAPDERIAEYQNLFFDRRSRSALLAPAMSRSGTAPADIPLHMPPAGTWSDSLDLHMRVDFLNALPGDMLVKLDRASMLTSLEVRAPFLDREVMDFAFGEVPSTLKASETERKILLRALGAKLLPASLDLKRKQGFSIPMDEWLKGEWGKVLYRALTDLPPTLFSQSRVRALVRGQQMGLTNAHRIFSLGMLELWRQEYDVAAW